MKVKETLLEEEERLQDAKGQEKVLLHEKFLGREYNERENKR